MIVTYIINVAIRKVRAALRDDPEKPHFVETVVGKGYRLAAPVIYGNGDSRLQVEVPAPSAPAETTVPSAGTKDALIPLRLVLIAAGVIVIVVVAFVTKRGSSKATSQPAIASRLRRNRNS